MKDESMSRRNNEEKTKISHRPRVRLDHKDFVISQDQDKYSIVEDVGYQKANITIGQLVSMVPTLHHELHKWY